MFSAVGDINPALATPDLPDLATQQEGKVRGR
jgi:hypothetical protein